MSCLNGESLQQFNADNGEKEEENHPLMRWRYYFSLLAWPGFVAGCEAHHDAQ